MPRIVNGSTHTEDGWLCVNRDECDIPRIPGLYQVDTAPLRKGAPLVILGAWIFWYDRNVEEIFTPVWGWSLTNDVLGQWGKNNGSNHLSGTAVDICAPKYPWGRLVMPRDKVAKVEEGLRLFSPTGRIEDSVVFWGRVWRKPDEMHYQMRFREGEKRNEEFAQKLLDGYLGIYKGRPAPPTQDQAALLAELMGNTAGVNYAQYVDSVSRCLRDCDCSTVERIAMWASQVGHECAGLRYMEEIWGPTAAQKTYEGRKNLGNTVKGDGYRFRGRGPLQVTGRHNYTVLSRWAYDQGLVPSPTFFVDDPDQLASPEYGFTGVVWYWTTQRPLNAAADAKDIVLATKYVNGGDHGLTDRRVRYNRALAMGPRLLNLLLGEDDWMSDPTIVKMIRELHAAMFNPIGSQSRYRAEGEGAIWELHELVKNMDGMTHESYIERLAILGDPSAVKLVVRNAGWTPTKDGKEDPLAQSVLVRIDDRYLDEDQRYVKNTVIVNRFGTESPNV